MLPLLRLTLLTRGAERVLSATAYPRGPARPGRPYPLPGLAPASPAKARAAAERLAASLAGDGLAARAELLDEHGTLLGVWQAGQAPAAPKRAKKAPSHEKVEVELETTGPNLWSVRLVHGPHHTAYGASVEVRGSERRALLRADELAEGALRSDRATQVTVVRVSPKGREELAVLRVD